MVPSRCCVCSVCTKHLILATACTGFDVHAARVCMCASPRWVQRGCCHGDRRPASAAVVATSQCPGSYLLIHPERRHTPTPSAHLHRTKFSHMQPENSHSPPRYPPTFLLTSVCVSDFFSLCLSVSLSLCLFLCFCFSPRRSRNPLNNAVSRESQRYSGKLLRIFMIEFPLHLCGFLAPRLLSITGRYDTSTIRFRDIVNGPVYDFSNFVYPVLQVFRTYFFFLSVFSIVSFEELISSGQRAPISPVGN